MKFYKITGYPTGLTYNSTVNSSPRIFSLASFSGASGFDYTKMVMLVIRYTIVIDTQGDNQEIYLKSTTSDGSSITHLQLRSFGISDSEHNTSGLLYIPVDGMSSVNIDFYTTWQPSTSYVRRVSYEIIGAVTT